ncbi:WAP, Kazal, immunoglobulin, Kunitz and NTR domain-containing protein [Acipenser ruthenus]|nr:WAP, Kazal, immunoglobulin, Kunitz and NTR domain-containing protein [Acipenser ruthenus]
MAQEQCEDNCPQRKGRPCKACMPKSKMMPSLCCSDFAIVGRLTEPIEDQDSGNAHFSLEEVLCDKKVGLAFFNTRHLEVTLAKVNWRSRGPSTGHG